jgi:mono/diheme cytochrome c family protein
VFNDGRVFNRFRILIGVTLAFGVVTALSFAQGDDDAKLAKGKYIAEEVARCEDCHTPRLLSGELVKSGWFKGTTLEYAPVTDVKGWHQKSPDITSTSALWARWGDDGMVAFLETAKNPRGGTAGPPMPPYKMSHEDALAVVAYLKSLK